MDARGNLNLDIAIQYRLIASKVGNSMFNEVNLLKSRCFLDCRLNKSRSRSSHAFKVLLEERNSLLIALNKTTETDKGSRYKLNGSNQDDKISVNHTEVS